LKTWVFAAAGACHGEAAIAGPIARAAAEAGRKVRVLVDRPEAARFFEGLEVHLLQRRAAITLLQPSDGVFVPCTSLLFRDELYRWADHGVPVVPIECSWMPWWRQDPERYHAVERVLAVMPAEVWRAGLRAGGGPFDLPPTLEAWVSPVGWTFAPPSPRSNGHPYVFVYPGTNPRVFRSMEETLWRALEGLHRDGLRILLRAEPGAFDHTPSWVERIDWLPPNDFAQSVAGAELLLCHNGFAAIAQAAVAGVPACGLSDGDLFRRPRGDAWADLELHALGRSNIVEPVHGRISAHHLAARLRPLVGQRRPPLQPVSGPARAIEILDEVTAGDRC